MINCYEMIILTVTFIFTLFLLYAKVEADRLPDVPPKLLPILKDQSFQEGSTATLQCTVTSGNTKGLIYEWFIDSTFVSNLPENKIKIITDSNNEDSRLKIFNVSQTDVGTYTCVAKNGFGQDKVSTKLGVIGKSTIMMNVID